MADQVILKDLGEVWDDIGEITRQMVVLQTKIDAIRTRHPSITENENSTGDDRDEELEAAGLALTSLTDAIELAVSSLEGSQDELSSAVDFDELEQQPVA